MRIERLAVIVSVVALGRIAAPTLARSPTPPPKTDDKPASSTCHAYQMAADGSWTAMPCQESGGQTEHRPAPKASQEQPRTSAGADRMENRDRRSAMAALSVACPRQRF